VQADGESDEEDGGAAGTAPVGRPRATTEARHACLAQPSRRGLFFACPLLSCSFLSQAVAAGLSSTLQQAEALEAAGFAEKAAEVRAAAMEAAAGAYHAQHVEPAEAGAEVGAEVA